MTAPALRFGRAAVVPRGRSRCGRGSCTPERATHDYKRHGTSSLYAALDLATGKVIGSLHNRHHAIEFHKFLQTIDQRIPQHLDVHIVLDNSSAHKTPKIQRWLAAHPRFHLHFTPTSSSWLNLVERWFAELTNKKLRRGAYRSVRASAHDAPRPPKSASGTQGHRTPVSSRSKVGPIVGISTPGSTA